MKTVALSTIGEGGTFFDANENQYARGASITDNLVRTNLVGEQKGRRLIPANSSTTKEVQVQD